MVGVLLKIPPNTRAIDIDRSSAQPDDKIGSLVAEDRELSSNCLI